ncbi:hypothetical protein [Paraprevotella clara]|uniref:hypothetical protein n=1 Tax=Paraprevotella clara TaxID=454154 RepID=UPI002675AAF5|nr:hypothetical protein [Paraprevotella clara]
MIQNTKILLKQLASRLSLALVVAVGFCMSVSAENKVSMDNLNIKSGETKTVAVFLDNSDAISTLQMDIKLPSGLLYKDNTLTRDEARLDRDSHTIYMNHLKYDQESQSNIYRLTILSQDVANIVGNSGAVVYFDVEANSSLIETRDIVLTNIVGSSSEKDEETGFTVKYELEDYIASVSPNIGQLFFTDDSLSVKTDGTSKKVDVSLINYVKVRGLQAVVTLPEGLSFETKDNGKPRFEYSDRLPQNAAISSNITEDGKLHLAISDLTGGTIEEKEDTTVLFSFYVKASENLAEISDITLSEVVISDNSDHGIEVHGTSTVKIYNSFIAYYTPANDSIQGLRTRYEAAVEKINTEAANVKDSAIVVNAVQEVATRIEDLRKSVDEAYANETLATVYDEVLAPVVEIDTAIVDMVEMVLDYQQKVTANEEAYTRLTADIAAVQAKLDAVKTTIEADYAEVAEQFTADIAALQEDIDSISNEVKGLYNEMKLTAESQIDATAIETGIEKVLADAAAALATEEAKKANEEAYTRLTADIAAVQAKLDAAKTTIETDYAEVAEQFTADIAALQEDIDSISNEVKGLYDEVKLTAESQIDATAIEAGIEKVLADAKKAHEGSSIAGVKGPEGAELLGIYTVSGKRVAAPLKGQVNIFKYSDGTVKKFYMK